MRKKRCTKCGRRWSAAQWARLPLVAHQCVPEDEFGPEEHREYRNCVCRSTLLVRVGPDHVGACALDEAMRDPLDRPRRLSSRPPSRPPSSRPRSAEGNEGLAYLLDRDVRAIGPERAAAPPAPDVRLLVSEHGSYRYVGLENGRPVSVLQIMSQDGGNRGVIANVYTTPIARRRGWAKRLLEVARKRFREVRHSNDLSPAGAAWKDVVRDADYRGQKVPFDFARATFEARRLKPGALEVLRDGIEEWFPKQYADAVADAEHHWSETRMPYVVLFNGRVARARFRRWQDARSTMRTPFDIRPTSAIVRNGMPPYSAIIWPRELVLRAPKHTS